jgi:hypothetical protein
MHGEHRRLDHRAVVDDLDRGDHSNDVYDHVDHTWKLNNVRSYFHDNRSVAYDCTSDDGRDSAGDGASEPAGGGGRSPR